MIHTVLYRFELKAPFPMSRIVSGNLSGQRKTLLAWKLEKTWVIVSMFLWYHVCLPRNVLVKHHPLATKLPPCYQYRVNMFFRVNSVMWLFRLLLKPVQVHCDKLDKSFLRDVNEADKSVKMWACSLILYRKNFSQKPDIS